MLTSAFPVDADALREAGIAEWLTKPVRSSELYDRLMRLMAANTASLAAPSTAETPHPSEAGSLGRVLVVEDNALNQLVAEGVVSKLGYQVDLVANGVEALEATQNTAYAAVLMDCHMPVMDGFAATREIRRRETSPSRIPIIAMTAGALTEDRDRCLAAGMDDYLPKPVNFTAVEQVLAQWVRPFPDAKDLAVATTDAAPEPTALSSEPPIDQQRLADLQELASPDQSDLLAVIISTFADDGANSMVTLRAAADAHAVTDLQLAAHELKGASANIGATRVATLCQEVEAGAHRWAESETSELLDQLEVELNRACRALAEAVPTS